MEEQSAFTDPMNQQHTSHWCRKIAQKFEPLRPTARKETPKSLILQQLKKLLGLFQQVKFIYIIYNLYNIYILPGYFCSHWSSARLFHVQIFLSGQSWTSYALHLSPVPNCFLGSVDLENFCCWESSLWWRWHSQKYSGSSHHPPLLSAPKFLIY